MTATTQPPLAGRRLHLFLSYARADADSLRSVEEGLETLHHNVWFDKKLDGGQDWWDQILAQIRECDAVIVVVSPALLESDAATKEREYARHLRKPLLPVQVVPVLADLLPEDIAPLHIIDYTKLGPMTGFQLAAALVALQPAPPLPDPLPPTPVAPRSRLSELAKRLSSKQLSLEDQLAVVAGLRVSFDHAREQAAAVQLLQALRRRQDLYYATWRELDELMQREQARQVEEPLYSKQAAPPTPTPGPPSHPTSSAPQNPTPGPPSHPTSSAPQNSIPRAAPGWYADPSGRHRLRWFDEEWTAYTSDHGPIIEDPNF